MTFHEAVDWVLLEKILFGMATGGLIGLERERQVEAERHWQGISPIAS